MLCCWNESVRGADKDLYRKAYALRGCRQAIEAWKRMSDEKDLKGGTYIVH